MDEIDDMGNCLRVLNGQNAGNEEFRNGFVWAKWKNRHVCGGLVLTKRLKHLVNKGFN